MTDFPAPAEQSVAELLLHARCRALMDGRVGLAAEIEALQAKAEEAQHDNP